MKLIASTRANVIVLLWTQIQLCILEVIAEVLQARNIREIDFIFSFYFTILFSNKGNPCGRLKLMGD